MTFWHGCSVDAWAAIQAEGVLWGRRNAPSRCTYLATDQAEAREHGEVLLRVEYEPGSGTDNYVEGCWQVRVYDPIPLEQVRRVD